MRRVLAGGLIALSGAFAAMACVVDEEFPDGQFLCDPKGGDDECPPGLTCTAAGQCRHAPAKPTDGGSIDGCFPKSCTSLYPKCGALLDDGCGSTLTCNCKDPDTCGGDTSRLGECGCLPNQQLAQPADASYQQNVTGGVNWNDADIANIKASDDLYATSGAMAAGESSDLLKASAFGIKLPAGITITGIAVDIERSASVEGAIGDKSVKLFGSATFSPGQPDSAAWTLVDKAVRYGGQNDLWGVTSIKPSDVEDSAFGVELAVTASAAASARVDQIKVTVFFENPACVSD